MQSYSRIAKAASDVFTSIVTTYLGERALAKIKTKKRNSRLACENVMSGNLRLCLFPKQSFKFPAGRKKNID